MSIFTETFQNFVFNQLKIREAALNQKSGRSLGAPKVEGLKGPNSEETNVTLPPGAFHTLTTSKQCIIRMSSGVDLKSENDLLDKSDIGKENLVGEGLAIRYMLEGGVPAKDVDFLNNRKEGQSEVKVIPRGRGTRQFTGGSGKDYGSAYGDPYIRSNAGDDFGIVPMPGIINAEIRTKTAYGSLRDAQINFVCHNRRQLDILETLYMRPGMPILLEWGWSTYINNKGIRENYFPYLWEWFNKNETLNNINKIIHKRIELAGGNYDGFVGYVKNFEIVSRPDGGYDCTTELSAMGEIVEGLTGKNEGLTLKETNGDVDVEVDNLEYYLEALRTYCETASTLSQEEITKTIQQTQNASDKTINLYQREDLRNKVQPSAKAYNNYNTKLKLFKSIQSDILPLVGVKNDTDLGEELTPEIEKSIRAGRREIKKYTSKDGTNFKKNFVNELEKTDFDQYLLHKGEKLGVEANELDNTESSYHYVRWDLLCDIINNLVINTYQTKKNSEPIIRLSYRKESPVGSTQNTYLQYSKFDFLQNSIRIVRQSTGEVLTLNIPDLLDMSISPQTCLLPHQIKGLIANSDDSLKNTYNIDNSETPDRNIGHIFIGLEYLIDRFKKLRYKGDEVVEDFNLLTFLQTIWEKDINNACGGTHNFLVSTEKTSGDVIRIIDITKGPEPNLTPTNLYNFKTHGLNSIVRDFNYNTTIDSKLSSTVAIAAQSNPNDIGNLDAVSFAAFNRNIQSRFFKELNDSEGKTNDARAKKAAEYDKDIDSVKKMLGYLYDYRVDMLQGKHEKNVMTALSFVKNLESKITSLKSRYSKDQPEMDPPIYKGYPRRKTNISKSTIIPLKFNCQIDGIGGLIIGNVFKVDKKFLPKGYEQDDIAFAIMTENQSITAGQDWTTEFSGQVILLDLKQRETYEDILIDDTLNPRPNQISSYTNRDPGGGDISTEQQNIDENVYNTENGATLYLKIDKEATNIRTGAEINNGSLKNNIAGVIPSGNKERINVDGLGKKLNEIIKTESQIFTFTPGDEINESHKEQIGYNTITKNGIDYVTINKNNFKERQSNSRGGDKYPSEDGKYLLEIGKKDVYGNNQEFKYTVSTDVTWYEIEFNKTALDIINKNQMKNNIGFMRVDVLQSSSDFNTTK